MIRDHFDGEPWAAFIDAPSLASHHLRMVEVLGPAPVGRPFKLPNGVEHAAIPREYAAGGPTLLRYIGKPQKIPGTNGTEHVMRYAAIPIGMLKPLHQAPEGLELRTA